MSANVAVVIVNWNGGEDLGRCLRALDADRSEWSHCLVVDNGSGDGSTSIVRARFPNVRLIETGRNLGYAGGNNHGIRVAAEAGASHVLVLNPDTAVAPGAVTALHAALEDDLQLAIVGPEIRRGDGTGRFWYAGGRILRSPFRARHVTERPPADGPHPVDYVPGCALMISRAVVERIGVFDERFFLTWEETDLCARARAAGLGCAIVPGAAVEHGRSPSFAGAFSPLYSYYYFRNMLLYASLHFRPRERAAAYRDTLGLAWRKVEAASARGDRTAVASATALGILHFFAGRFGPAPGRYTEAALRARLARTAATAA